MYSDSNAHSRPTTIVKCDILDLTQSDSSTSNVRYITTGRLYQGFKVPARETTMSWHSWQETDNVINQQQHNSAMVMLLSGSWQPDRQYNIGTKNTSDVAEPLRNQSGRSTSAMYEIRKIESTCSQLHKTSKIIEKLLLSTKLCVLEKITFFLKESWILLDFRVDLRSANDM